MIITSTLKLKSFNNYSLKKTEVFIKEKAKLLDLTFNAKQLKNKKKRFTLLKSPHVHKKARDQYELSTFTNVLSLRGSKKNTLSFFQTFQRNLEKDITMQLLFEKD
jgi:small subunit ribosomal protein S10